MPFSTNFTRHAARYSRITKATPQPTCGMRRPDSKPPVARSPNTSSEQSVPAERRHRTIHKLKIIRRRPLNGDVLSLSHVPAMQWWTIQTEEAYRILERDGEIATRRHFADPDFVLPYDWMAGEMKARIGPPPQSDLLPVWAWSQFESAASRRPGQHCI